MKSLYYLYLFLWLGLLVACRNDSTYQGNTPKITASVDTLKFDTIFTTIGSATKSFKLYNREDQDILVNVALQNGTDSPYRLNIDGTAASDRKELLIRANDSIYVFADVTINPNAPITASPFFVEDKIEVTSASTKKDILLTAYGQNANYLTGKNVDSENKISCDLNTMKFEDPRPYVIYGDLTIDSCDIVLPAGTKLYVHGGVTRKKGEILQSGNIIFKKYSSLTANGNTVNPVIFSSDNLNDEEAGQWAGITLDSTISNNNLKNTIVKNAVTGVTAKFSKLSIENSKIQNNSLQGIKAKNATLNIKNSLISDNGGVGVYVEYGGNYNIIQSTIASYRNGSEAAFFRDFTCEDIGCETSKNNPLNLSIKNTIITGDSKEEFVLEAKSTINLDLQNNLSTNDILNCQNCITHSLADKLFVNTNKGDYHLGEQSIAKDKGQNTGIPLDIDGYARDGIYDIGCYESTF